MDIDEPEWDLELDVDLESDPEIVREIEEFHDKLRILQEEADAKKASLKKTTDEIKDLEAWFIDRFGKKSRKIDLPRGVLTLSIPVTVSVSDDDVKELQSIVVKNGITDEAKKIFKHSYKVNKRDWDKADRAVKKALAPVVTSKNGTPKFTLKAKK